MDRIDPELSDLVAVPDDGPDAPDALVNFEPFMRPTSFPDVAPTTRTEQLERSLKRDVLADEELVPAERIKVEHEQPLPSPMGTPAELNTSADAEFLRELERDVHAIAHAASAGDDPLGITSPSVEKARKLDRTLLTKMIALADEEGLDTSARVLRMIAKRAAA
ncbi:MAG: hypothetical protein ACR2IF_13700 [Terriglobales bacterium]